MRGAVCHIPQGGGTACLLRLAGGWINLVYDLIAIVHIQLFVGGVIGSGHHVSVQRKAWRPGFGMLQIPGEEHGIARSILHHTHEGDRHMVDCDGAAGADIRALVGGGRNQAGTGADCRNVTGRVHGRDAFVAGGPGDTLVQGRPGLHHGSQTGTAALPHVDGSFGEHDAVSLLRRICPCTVGTLILVRDQQAGQLIVDVVVLFHVVIVLGVNFEDIREEEPVGATIGPNVFIAGPDQMPGVGVYFHGRGIKAGKCVIPHGCYLFGSVHGIQGELVDIWRIVFVAVEGAVAVAG